MRRARETATGALAFVALGLLPMVLAADGPAAPAAPGGSAAPAPAGSAPPAAAAPAVKPLEAGDPAPAFKLQGSDGKTYSLADFKGKKTVVLAWFPKAFTGG